MSKLNTITQEAYAEEKVVVAEGRRQRHRVEVFAISADNKILATSTEMNGYLELPGGGINMNEDTLAAAVRETEEEAGWVVTNPRLLDIRGNWGYIAPDESWLKHHGYDEEVNFVVVCDAVEFKPKDNYRSEGDGRTHELLPVQQVVKETVYGMNSCEDTRVKLLGQLRLTAIKMLFGEQQVQVESLPLLYKW